MGWRGNIQRRHRLDRIVRGNMKYSYKYIRATLSLAIRHNYWYHVVRFSFKCAHEVPSIKYSYRLLMGCYLDVNRLMPWTQIKKRKLQASENWSDKYSGYLGEEYNNIAEIIDNAEDIVKNNKEDERLICRAHIILSRRR